MSYMNDVARLLSAGASHLRLIIPIGALGAWRWAMWAGKRIPALFYRPIENDYDCDATIVAAVFMEDPTLFRRALQSWIANAPTRIIAVIDTADAACLEVAAEFPEVEVIRDGTPGKRPKLVRGVDAATTDIVVLVDSDVIWEPEVLRKLKMPFADSKIGGVSARAYMYPTTEGRPTVWERLANFYLESRFSTEVPATTRWGRAVSCLSGRTSAYRTKLLQSLREPFLNETFNGKPCISGDDKCYTMLVLKSGYRTWHQLNARVYSTFKPTLDGLVRQRLRWSRNSFRSDFRALGQKWIWRHPYLAAVLIDKQFALVTQLNSPLCCGIAVASGHWRFALAIVLWWHISRAIKIGGHLLRHPGDLSILPLFVAMTFVNTVIRLYGLLTLNTQGWLTRPVGLQNGQVVRLTVDAPDRAAASEAMSPAAALPSAALATAASPASCQFTLNPQLSEQP